MPEIDKVKTPYDKLYEKLNNTGESLPIEDIKELYDKSVGTTRKALDNDDRIMYEILGRRHYYYPRENVEMEMIEFDKKMDELDAIIKDLKKEFPHYPQHILNYIIENQIYDSIKNLTSIDEFVNNISNNYQNKKKDYENVIEEITDASRDNLNPHLKNYLCEYLDASHSIFYEAFKKHTKLIKQLSNTNHKYRNSIREYVKELKGIMDGLYGDAKDIVNYIMEHIKTKKKISANSNIYYPRFMSAKDAYDRNYTKLQKNLQGMRTPHPTFEWDRKCTEDNSPQEYDDAEKILSKIREDLKEYKKLVDVGIKKAMTQEDESELYDKIDTMKSYLKCHKDTLDTIQYT